MTAKSFQKEIKNKLEAYFGNETVVEWPISRGAADRFVHDKKRYSPRVDVAVFTAGVTPGNHFEKIAAYWREKAPTNLQERFNKLQPNGNPRCALAIEVTYSGSSKHILGDITNASMMGLFGIVVPSFEMEPKVKRIWEYVIAIRAVGKAPVGLFDNTIVIPQKEFTTLIEKKVGGIA